MKRLVAAILTLALSFAGMTSASACCLWPFGGWWGAGYGGGYYGANYAPYVPANTGYYSAGYGSMSYAGSDCCAPVCCDPCGCGTGGCGPGGCAPASCVGTVAPTGSLKPETDSNFDKSPGDKGTYDDDQFDRDRLRARDKALDREPDPLPGARELPPRARTRPVEPDPIDDFRSSPAGGARGTNEPFGSGADEIKNKPPMEEPAGDLPAVEPAIDPAPGGNPFKLNDSTFFEADDLKPNDQTRHERPVSLSDRASGLNEVIAPKRLASRSLPAAPARAKTTFAGRTTEDKSSSKPPLRWISVPMPEGNVRL